MYGIYLHIPFCERKCPYCDFYSLPANDALRTRYVQALINQIASFPRVQADTVYFGGGTPSLLTAAQMADIMAALRRCHDIAADAEISMECNPASASKQKLADFRAAGINRLSLGCQSFQPQTLAARGRLHSAEEAMQTVRDAREAGFENISVDLMLGVPHQTPALARADAETALSLGVDHISAYLLKIAEGTPFANGVDGLPDEDTQAACYAAFSDAIRAAGYRHYEISNYARQGFESRHNLKYWRCGRWLGLGPAAHMSDGTARYSACADIDRFLAAYEDGPQPDPMALLQKEGDVDGEEYIIMALRTDGGLSQQTLAERFGVTFSAAQQQFLRRCEAEGYLQLQGDRICLTPEGWLLSNAILTELI